MRPCRFIRLFLAVLLLHLGAAILCVPPVEAQSTEPAFRVLLFTKTVTFRHDSIPAGIAAIQQLGRENGFAVDPTEDSGAFTDANLANYRAVIFLLTTGDVLNAEQQAVFERYIRGGGGYAGVHSASDTEYSWPWYGKLVGAYFKSHPATQPGTILVEDPVHPSTSILPRRWIRTDEFYDFQSNPRGQVHVLASLDERTYSGGTMGHDHPIAWTHNFEGGRAWYTGLGHTAESYSEPLFLRHLLGGIQVAAGVKLADATATVSDRFQKVILDDHTLDPMQLDIAPDGRVVFIERAGRVKIYRPDAKATVLAGKLDVTTTNEDGLLGLALDPHFAQNGWIYLFYSPSSPSEQRVSRFTMAGDAMDLASEKVLLRIPVQRQECCHSAGALAFGPDGSLFISTGDNTNPFPSGGFAPLDERPGQSPRDAQKSSSNTNDLRGKILRIRPQPDGGYAIPEGNLFPPGTPETRPEIYVMGVRNPFRISVDSETGVLYWGDVGPDATEDQPLRGPRGYDEFNRTRGPGNFGWPYFIADNKPYRNFDFATDTPGALFDPAAPVNDSPNNTGLRTLPPAQPAWIWYPYAASAEFPEFGLREGAVTDGRTAMAGPVYHYNPALASDRKLPAYYDDTLFLYDWTRNWIKEVKLDGEGNLLKANPFAPNLTFRSPMDMKIGPDGAIYLLEWGSGFASVNADSQLVRIDFTGGPRAPVARADASPGAGIAPLAVAFSSAETLDPEGSALAFAWDFNGDGTTDSTEPNPTFTYTQNGA
ncbi:MAG: ThuA domain-containing protein, partial [Armatimonadetes bacterium]|nr:ThuA domain-containing protein [Armatimonadota bacterium]